MSSKERIYREILGWELCCRAKEGGSGWTEDVVFCVQVDDAGPEDIQTGNEDPGGGSVGA